MAEVIPAIIAKDFEELKKKIAIVEPYTEWVQLDVMDGDFVPNQTWNNPQDLKTEDFSVFFEAHLMISNPEKHIDKWIEAGMKRIIVHIEAIGEERSHTKKEPAYHLINDLAEKCHQNEVEFGIAINPETSVDILSPIISESYEASPCKIDLVLFLTVSPGFGGQKFQELVLPKISAVRKKYPDVKIEVDGGINPKTAKQCVEAGANILVSGSYIFTHQNVKRAIETLKTIGNL